LYLLILLNAFEKSRQIHLTAVNVSYNIKIAQIAHNNYLQSVAIVRKQVGDVRRKGRGYIPKNKQEY